MTRPAQAPNVADTVFSTLLSAVQANQEQIVQGWSRGCGLYARYFSALSKAHGPEDLLAANADLVASGLDAVAKRAAALPRFDGLGQTRG